MPRPVISVEHLSKAYRIGLKEEVPDTLTSALIGFAKAPLRKFQQLRRLDTFRHTGDAEDIVWALKDVSFEVHEGEVLGVIGRNGAGKSTLLKILSRITEPTSGRAVIRGRVSSLLEVGTGFHPELSGRENVYLNGTILGMTKAEIDRKFDEIVDFSGVEKFLDTPIKRYSSGMKVRLAFAVAAHLEPEILIIDEVLAVGDAEFQKKCMGKMQDVARGGRTVLFVSHNMAAVETLCTNGIQLQHGGLIFAGHAEDTVAHYRRTALQIARSKGDNLLANSRIIRNVAIIGNDGAPTGVVAVSHDLLIRITLAPEHPIRFPKLGIGIDCITGERALTVHTPATRQTIGPLLTPTVIDCHIPGSPLAPGEYTLKLAVSENNQELETAEGVCAFTVDNGEIFSEGRGFHRGLCVAKSEWIVAN